MTLTSRRVQAKAAAVSCGCVVYWTAAFAETRRVHRARVPAAGGEVCNASHWRNAARYRSCALSFLSVELLSYTHPDQRCIYMLRLYFQHEQPTSPTLLQAYRPWTATINVTRPIDILKQLRLLTTQICNRIMNFGTAGMVTLF